MLKLLHCTRGCTARAFTTTLVRRGGLPSSREVRLRRPPAYTRDPSRPLQTQGHDSTGSLLGGDDGLDGVLSHPSKEFQASIQTQIEDFRRQLQDPDHVLVREPDAKEQFGLTKHDLADISFTEKENPYEDDEGIVKQYPLTEIVSAARAKYKHESTILARYRKYLEKAAWRRHMQAVYGMDDVVDGVRDSANRRALGHQLVRSSSGLGSQGIEGLTSVRQGLISNSAIAGVKGVVFAFTGSAAILADFMHSAADVSNYSYRYYTLLQVGRLRFGRSPSPHH